MPRSCFRERTAHDWPHHPPPLRPHRRPHPAHGRNGAGAAQAASLTTNGGEFAHRNAISDANYTATANDDIIAYTALTAARTLTIPCASLGTAANPQKIIVKDESGPAGAFPISLAATIDGSTTKAINTAYGSMRLYANGAACFTW